jgi:hypothetical protein
VPVNETFFLFAECVNSSMVYVYTYIMIYALNEYVFVVIILPSVQWGFSKKLEHYLEPIFPALRNKEEALDRTMWRARFGRSFGPVVRLLNERIK